MLSISQDLEEENDDFTLHESEDNILLEDTPDEMEEKVDIGLEDEEDEVIIINEEDEIEETHPDQSRESSDAFCNRDGTDYEEERSENIYAEKSDPKNAKDNDIPVEDEDIRVEDEDIPVENIDIPVEDEDLPVEDEDIPGYEDNQKKSKQMPEKKSKSTLINEDEVRKQKKDSDPSPEELEEELRAAYKSSQKKTKTKTSNLVNLEGCQKLLDQAQVRITLSAS